jgi:hypothetical protein
MVKWGYHKNTLPLPFEQENTMTDLTVANTILEQLGGPMFTRMTGAHNLAGDETSLRFSLHRGSAHNGINKVIVTLTPMDTYTVQFWNIRLGSKSCSQRLVAEHEDVYCDMLQDVFEQATGLYTSLFRR